MPASMLIVVFPRGCAKTRDVYLCVPLGPWNCDGGCASPFLDEPDPVNGLTLVDHNYRGEGGVKINRS